MLYIATGGPIIGTSVGIRAVSDTHSCFDGRLIRDDLQFSVSLNFHITY